MVYRDICNVKFPDLSETIRLMQLSVDGNDEVRWMFVMSQTPWIKEVIAGSFPKYSDDDELVSDRILALYKYVCRNKRKDISVSAFRGYALHYIRRDMLFGIRYRESQMMKRTSKKFASESSLNNDDIDPSVEFRMEDPCGSNVVDTVCDHDEGDLMASICKKILESNDRYLTRMLKSLKKLLEHDKLSHIKDGKQTESRNNVYTKRIRLAARIIKRYPELKEIFHNMA